VVLFTGSCREVKRLGKPKRKRCVAVQLMEKKPERLKEGSSETERCHYLQFFS